MLGAPPVAWPAGLDGPLPPRASLWRACSPSCPPTEDLARLLVERVNDRDVEGVVEPYEPEAVLALAGGTFAVGHDAIRAFYADLLAAKPIFDPGDQHPALCHGELALTSTRLAGAGATAEVARRQPDGSWRWVLDRPNVLE